MGRKKEKRLMKIITKEIELDICGWRTYDYDYDYDYDSLDEYLNDEYDNTLEW